MNSIDRSTLYLLIFIVVVLAIGIGSIGFITYQRQYSMQNTPCENMQSWTRTDVSARCFEYWGIK